MPLLDLACLVEACSASMDPKLVIMRLACASLSAGCLASDHSAEWAELAPTECSATEPSQVASIGAIAWSYKHQRAKKQKALTRVSSSPQVPLRPISER